VVVRAPWLAQGYLHEPERSEELWRGGWLHTGDVGAIDGEGYLRIVGTQCEKVTPSRRIRPSSASGTYRPG